MSRVYYKIPIEWLTDATSPHTFVYVCLEKRGGDRFFMLITADGGWIKLCPGGKGGFFGPGSTFTYPKGRRGGRTIWSYTSITYPIDGEFQTIIPNNIDTLEVGPEDLPDIYAAQELAILGEDLPALVPRQLNIKSFYT